jgi:hypothetical protein
MGIAAFDSSTLSISTSECTAAANPFPTAHTKPKARHGSRKKAYVFFSFLLRAAFLVAPS